MSFFENPSILPVLSIGTFAVSYYFYTKESVSKTLFFIVLGGLFLRLFCINDAYLHDWDEQFHALVSKNLIKHWLKPTLIDVPVLPYDFQDWAMNHIWLSKQPLPLWSMALSMKLFGVNLWALRLPSLIISISALLVTYKIAAILFNNRMSLYAAFLYSIHGTTIEVATGRDSSDHVQCFFDFFIALGILTAILSKNKPNKMFYSILSGACMGCAFMCKWYPAFLVFPIWIFFNYKNQKFILNLLAFGVGALVVALPWQIYILTHFPIEAKWMYSATLITVNETIQGHGGEWWYYLNDVRIMFGEIIYIPMIWLCLMAFKKRNNTNIRFLLLWIGLPMLIFSLSATKRQLYLLIMAPAFFMLTAYFAEFLKIYRLKMRFNPKFISLILFLLFALPIRYSFERIKPFHLDKFNTERTVWLKKLDEKTGGEGAIVFNIGDYVRAMFFSNITVAYRILPTSQQIDDLKQKGYRVFIIKNENVTPELLLRTDVHFIDN